MRLAWPRHAGAAGLAHFHLAATVRVLREPRGTLCEDLRDGIRLVRPNGLP